MSAAVILALGGLSNVLVARTSPSMLPTVVPSLRRIVLLAAASAAACFNPTGQTDEATSTSTSTATSIASTSDDWASTSEGSTTASTMSSSGETTSAATTSTSSSTTDASTTGEPTCAEAAQPDLFCAELDPTRPLCDLVAQACVACLSAADCGGEEDVCDGQTGQCVECAGDVDCTTPEAPACDPGSKTCGCTEHDQCPETACALELGQCFPEAFTAVVYSRAWDDPSCDDPLLACDEQEPCCSIKDALVKGAAKGKSYVVIRVSPGMNGLKDPGLTLGNEAIGKRVAILGEGRPVLSAPGGAPVVYVNIATTRAYLAGLVLEGASAGAGVSCVGGELVWVDDVEVRSLPGGVGLFTSACALTARRSAVHGALGGLRVALGGALRGENLMVSSVSSYAVQAEGGGAADLVFSTITERSGQPGRLLKCSGAGSMISARSSALFAAPEAGSIACVGATAVDSAVTDEALESDSVVVIPYPQVPGLFVDWAGDDLHVQESAAALMDVALRAAGDPTTDFDRAPRPVMIGARDWAGADRP